MLLFHNVQSPYLGVFNMAHYMVGMRLQIVPVAAAQLLRFKLLHNTGADILHYLCLCLSAGHVIFLRRRKSF